ncbi:MAG TPA: GMC family oxidoreductase N-terminal domain-containing protein, partial [Macromonas sp.]|nr:GMC family oxidoreductase N-terminal domain-containing protein [Macromonas sp.]
MHEADYVIVGGGSAGCVLAARLSEDPRNRVILIEAGGHETGWKLDLPGGSLFLMGRDRYDWRYEAEPDPTLNHRKIGWPAGRMLGGGSAINGQVYIRGTRADFNRWVEQGCTGWGFDDVLPYFKKSERYEGPNPPASHGLNGPMTVAPPRWKDPLHVQFVQACQQVGLPFLDDYCNGDQFGVFECLGTSNGKRCSTAMAYIEPILGRRPNLTLIDHAYARRLLVQNGRATGVEIARQGGLSTISARAEVIVASGSVGSPALLLRSGIGDAEVLQQLGIAPVAHLPGVGRNLQEHSAVMVGRLVNSPTINSRTGPIQGLAMVLDYLLRKQGPMSAIGAPALALAKTSDDLAEPDVQYHFSPLLYSFDANSKPVLDKRPGVQIATNVCRPHSRGEIRLRDANPDSRPIIDHQAFSDERDLTT